MPWERPMVGVFLCSKARFFSAASSRSTSAIRISAARTSCTLRQVSSTSDEVMPCLAFDLVDPSHVERGLAALVPDFLGHRLRDDAQFRHGIGGVGFDLE